ncbi:murein hydrolase activator EnvC family protein [Marinicrinis sediminis]|uniref:Murein hydrolase activator EnvC family protein n=1 Tax=Marinicrinis sediminis TaxID=1652465 RepID=A0ABW5RCZ8_9BACL
MKKVAIWSLFAALIVASFTFTDQGTAKTSISQLDKEIAALRQQQQNAKQNAEEAMNKMSSLEVEIQTAEADLDQIMDEIEETDLRLRKTQQRIQQTETQLSDAETRLADAQARIVARDEKLKSRLKIMYMNGDVSYLEVLLESTSFADFLDRFDGLKSLVDQDKDILEQNKRDEQIVLDQKLEIEGLLASLTEDYQQMEDIRYQLALKEKKKAVMIAGMEEEHHHLESYGEEMDELLRQTASQISKKANEKRKLEEEERARAAAAAAAAAEAARKKNATKNHTNNNTNQVVTANSGGEFGYPLDQWYPKTSNFGYRVDPITGAKSAFHGGTDIGAPGGTTIVASASGTVIHADAWSSFGNIVIIDHHNGYWTYYAHMSRISVKNGQVVDRGQKIGEVGTTGRSTGNHLHFEIRKDEGRERIDPASFINFN